MEEQKRLEFLIDEYERKSRDEKNQKNNDAQINQIMQELNALNKMLEQKEKIAELWGKIFVAQANITALKNTKEQLLLQIDQLDIDHKNAVANYISTIPDLSHEERSRLFDDIIKIEEKFRNSVFHNIDKNASPARRMHLEQSFLAEKQRSYESALGRTSIPKTDIPKHAGVFTIMSKECEDAKKIIRAEVKKVDTRLKEEERSLEQYTAEIKIEQKKHSVFKEKGETISHKIDAVENLLLASSHAPPANSAVGRRP